MKPKINWFFALVFLLSIKYSSAGYKPNERLDQLSFDNVDELFREIAEKIKELTDHPEEYIDDYDSSLDYVSGHPINSEVARQLISKWKDFETYLSKKEQFDGNIRRAVNHSYAEGYQDIIDRLGHVNTLYHNYSALFTDLGIGQNCPSEVSPARNFTSEMKDKLLRNINTTLQRNHEILFKQSFIKSRENNFLNSLKNEYKEGVDQCDTCPVRAQKLFWLYWPLIKSEIQGFFTISRACHMNFYIERKEQDELKFYKDQFLKRIRQYFDRIPSCSCTMDPWGYRISNSRTVIWHQPINPIQFWVKGVLNATIFHYYSNINDYIAKIELRQTRVQLYDHQSSHGYLHITFLNTDKFYSFEFTFTDSDYGGFINLRYSDDDAGGRNTYWDYPKLIYPKWDKNRTSFYTIISHDLDAEWMIKDVVRSSLTEPFMPQNDVYWCPFNGEMPPEPVQMSNSTYVAREFTTEHGYRNTRVDTNINRLNQGHAHDSDASASYDILTGCGLLWEKATNETFKTTIRRAIITTEFIDRELNISKIIFICRGDYNGESRIGQLDGHQCIVIDNNEGHVITDYEILVHPRK